MGDKHEVTMITCDACHAPITGDFVIGKAKIACAACIDRMLSAHYKKNGIRPITIDDLNTMMERTVKKANMKVQSTLW